MRFLPLPLFYINITSPSPASSQKKTREIPSEMPPLFMLFVDSHCFDAFSNREVFSLFFRLAWAEASRAKGTRYGEQLT